MIMCMIATKHSACLRYFVKVELYRYCNVGPLQQFFNGISGELISLEGENLVP